MFMAYKDVMMLDDTDMFHVMTRCRQLGALAQVHAENGSIIAEVLLLLYSWCKPYSSGENTKCDNTNTKHQVKTLLARVRNCHIVTVNDDDLRRESMN